MAELGRLRVAEFKEEAYGPHAGEERVHVKDTDDYDTMQLRDYSKELVRALPLKTKEALVERQPTRDFSRRVANQLKEEYKTVETDFDDIDIRNEVYRPLRKAALYEAAFSDALYDQYEKYVIARGKMDASTPEVKQKLLEGLENYMEPMLGSIHNTMLDPLETRNYIERQLEGRLMTVGLLTEGVVGKISARKRKREEKDDNPAKRQKK